MFAKIKAVLLLVVVGVFTMMGGLIWFRGKQVSKLNGEVKEKENNLLQANEAIKQTKQNYEDLKNAKQIQETIDSNPADVNRELLSAYKKN